MGTGANVSADILQVNAWEDVWIKGGAGAKKAKIGVAN
jgi:hypothetical protein